MYNPGMQATENSTLEICNASIYFKEILGGYVHLDITLPWGTTETDWWFDLTPGNDYHKWTTTNGSYILKVTDIGSTTATFQALSQIFLYKGFNFTDNIPTEGEYGSTINYTYDITNNESSTVQIRWLLASKISTISDFPRSDVIESLPPTTYKKIDCWYDDWISGTCFTGRSIASGSTTTLSGSFTLGSDINKLENISLMIFVYVPDYWGTGKHEYVHAVSWTKSILITDVIPTTGSISCTTTPSGAQIWLDGTNSDQVTTYTLTNVPTGSHNITFMLAGYNDCDVNVTVTVGSTVNADCTLDETLPSFYMKSYTFNYSVPSFYPTWYINGALYVLNGTGGLVDKLSSVINPDEFEFTSITFDEQSRLIKILVTNKTVPLSLNTSEHTTKSMAFFVIILIPAILDALVAIGIGALISAGLYVIWSHLVGESVGTTPSIIQYNVTPLICSGTSSLPMDDEITVKYRCGEAAEKIEKIPAGKSLPITCESGVLELNINATSKKYGTAVLKTTQENKNPVLCFKNEGQGTLDLTADKCTYYVITQQLEEGLSTKVIKALDGILPTTVNAGEVCITPMPCDLENFVPPVIPCDKIGKGETKIIDTTYEACIVAKNRIYLSTLFIPSGLTKQDAIGFIPDKVKLMNGTTVVQEKVPTSSATIFEYVDVDINYKVVIESADYVQPTDMIVRFSYDPTKPETLCGNFADKTIYANPLNTSYSITFDVKDSATTLPIINATIIINGDRVKTYKTNLSGQLSIYLQKVTNTPHKIEIEATGYKAISFDYSPTANEIVYKTLDSTVTQALYNSRISDVKPSTTINSGGIVKFTGKIEGYKDNVWNNLSGAIVYVKITDISDKELRTFTTTSSVFGNFETGEWLIPKDLSNKEIIVTATFDATGDYKTATPFSTSYIVGEGCCLSLPFFGCIATQSTCNNIKTVAYIGGGLLIGYIGYKIFVKK